MRSLARVALSIGAAALLAACGGSPPPIGAPGVVSPSDRSRDYRVLHSFAKSPDGQQPKAGLIDVKGTLYGTTYGGGINGLGTVFSISPSGDENVLYSFQGVTDGANPSASLIAVKGLLYGTTEYGGASQVTDGYGTVFSVSTKGVENVIYRFLGYYYYYRHCGPRNYCYDGAFPVSSLIDVKGKLYGTTSGGGYSVYGGTVFSVSTSGSETVLHRFGGYSDGAQSVGNLINVHGTLYGTTEDGGNGSSSYPYCCGTIFSVTKNGTEKIVYAFLNYDVTGTIPEAGLIRVKGTLYGTAGYGGVYNDGTVFAVTTSGHPTSLHTFGSGSDGRRPFAPLLNVRGTLYGTTYLGGVHGKGTIFKISLGGKEEVLHSFGHRSDGANPLAGLIDVNGTLYGTTSAGGTYGNGTVFALTLAR